MQNKIAVIGANGFVGRAAVDFFTKAYDVVKYDLVEIINGEKVELSQTELINKQQYIRDNCNIVVVCVPTPFNKFGFNLSAIWDTLLWLEQKNNFELIIIKSTLTPSDLKELKESFKDLPIIFNPEFIGESTYNIPEHKYFDQTSIAKTPWHIFGGEKKLTKKAVDIYMAIAGAAAAYIQTDMASASLCKIISNSWAATKVTWANEMYDICEKAGADWQTVRELWALNPFFERMHTMVLPGKRGFGGKCLPKDLAATIAEANNCGYQPLLLEMVQKLNKYFLGKNEQ